jgi:hypothetical protein
MNHRRWVPACQDLFLEAVFCPVGRDWGALGRVEHHGALVIEADFLWDPVGVLGADHPQTLTSMSNLAGTLLRMGQPELAEPLFRQALVASERLLGPEHFHTQRVETNLRMTLYQMRKS